MLPKVSPSRLDRLSSCPRFVFDDRDTRAQEARQNAMDAGTSSHAIMEEISLSPDPVARIAEIPDFPTRKAAEYSWSQVSGIIAAGASIVGAEVPVKESSVCKRGKADLILRYVDTMMVVDWKFVRSECDPRLQMMAYTIALFEENDDVQCVRAIVISPLSSGTHL